MVKAFRGVMALLAVAGACLTGVSYVSAADAQVISDVYAENLTQEGRYVYSYPAATSFIYETNREKHEGNASLIIALDTKTYSGAAIGNYPQVDLAEIRNAGKLEFWVKGNVGGERCAVTLIDSDNADGMKTEVSVRMSPKYVTLTKEWQKVSIPLADFPDKGQYWDGSKTNPSTFEWSDYVEVKFAIGPQDNKDRDSFIIYVDDVKIVK